jgi:hypothetical protein
MRSMPHAIRRKVLRAKERTACHRTSQTRCWIGNQARRQQRRWKNKKRFGDLVERSKAGEDALRLLFFGGGPSPG